MILVHWTHGDMSFLTHTVVINRETVKSAKNTICDTSPQNLPRYEFFDSLANTLVISSKTVQSPKNMTSDTCALIYRRYDFNDMLAHTVLINRKTVKSAKNTTCDICALNSPRYEFFHNLAHTVVISLKKSNQKRKRFKLIAGCQVPIFSYFFSQFLFSPIFTGKPSIFPIFCHETAMSCWNELATGGLILLSLVKHKNTSRLLFGLRSQLKVYLFFMPQLNVLKTCLMLICFSTAVNQVGCWTFRWWHS